jgi:hypothetical protein
MLLPRFGRNHRIEDAAHASDTWDRYATKRKSAESRSVDEPVATAFPETAASHEGVVQAFASSNAMAAIGSGHALDDGGRRLVRDQSRQRSHDAYNRNILPRMATSTLTTPEEYYLAGPRVADREKRGSYTDRLGNRYDVYESRPPPADKDYTSIAPSTSHRQLERCQGANPDFYDRPKREVPHENSPAEPDAEEQRRKGRSAAEEMEARQTFFNRSGMQRAADIDTGRQQYDGHNVKTRYEDLVHAVEPCWRATLIRDQTVRAEPADVTLDSPRPSVGIRRTEASAAFRRAPNQPSAPVAATGAGRIALPYLRKATLRASPLLGGHERQAAAFAHGSDVGNHGVDAVIKPEFVATENRRAVAELGMRSTGSVTLNGTDASSTQPVANGGVPLAFGATLADASGRGDTQRDADMVKPVPSREWRLVQQMAAAVERAGDDDHEVTEITRHATDVLHAAAPPQAHDHRQREDVVEDPRENRDLVVAAAPRLGSEGTRVGADVQQHPEPRHADVVHVQQAQAAKPTRSGHEEMHHGPGMGASAVKGAAVDALVQLRRSDVYARDDARAEIARAMGGGVVHAAPQINAERTQCEAMGAPDSRAMGGGVVHAAPQINAERTQCEAMGGPDSRSLNIGAARTALPARTLRAPAEGSRTGLPIAAVANVPLRSQATAAVPQRATTSRSVPMLPAFQSGKFLAATVQTSREETGTSRLHSSHAEYTARSFAPNRGDRAAEARSTYGNMPLRCAQSFVGAGARASPVASSARAGTQALCRIESKSVQGGMLDMPRPCSSLGSRERATPTMSMVAHGRTDALGGRVTPAMQQQGTSRDLGSMRVFGAAEGVSRPSTPAVQPSSTRVFKDISCA